MLNLLDLCSNEHQISTLALTPALANCTAAFFGAPGALTLAFQSGPPSVVTGTYRLRAHAQTNGGFNRPDRDQTVGGAACFAEVIVGLIQMSL